MSEQVDVFEEYIDKYMEEVQPEQTREIIMQGLAWHVLTEFGFGSKPIGMIGYKMVTSGYTYPHLYLEFIYIDKAYRAGYKFWLKRIADFCKNFSSKKVEIQGTRRTKRLIEKIFKKKPSVFIYEIDADEVGEHYGW